jgi:hypothetical protein
MQTLSCKSKLLHCNKGHQLGFWRQKVEGVYVAVAKRIPHKELGDETQVQIFLLTCYVAMVRNRPLSVSQSPTIIISCVSENVGVCEYVCACVYNPGQGGREGPLRALVTDTVEVVKISYGKYDRYFKSPSI